MATIVIAPNAVLLGKTKKIQKINKNVLGIIEEMKQALLSANDPEGVGLAAPQIRQPLSIFIAKPFPKSPIQVFINPKIIHAGTIAKGSKRTSRKLEGCLSLPNIWGHVKRKSDVTLSYLDEKGKSHTRKFKGFMATIVQHEADHLNGTLFTKHVLEQKGTLYKSYKDEKGEVVFEEIEI